MRLALLAIAALVLATACGPEPAAPPTPSATPAATPAPPAVLMPDLVGLATRPAGQRIGRLEQRARLGLVSDWRPQPVTDCAARPGTVVAQSPAPGTALTRRTTIRVRTAVLDLARFRGPCAPPPGADDGPARAFYRFAADPAGQDPPFAAGPVWNGLAAGPTGAWVDPGELRDLTAWRLERSGYAERTGPFSALDVVAASGGRYELHRGVVPTCPSGDADPPPELAGLEAVTLTAPTDTLQSCMHWWGVSLFLDGGLVRGVALRLGSP